jgi:V8-like Glu-specific endopeptidase
MANTQHKNWQLDRADFDRLVRLLSALPDWGTPDRRLDFLEYVFAGSARKDDLLSLIDVSGTPRAAAVRLITRLVQFGQDEPGQETLGVLVNRLLTYSGGGADADFLRGLFDRYPLTGAPVSTRALPDWRGRESPADVQEKVIGENTLRDVRMLELALEASRAVIRIDTGGGLGTGFLVAPGLIMTNNHVIPAREAALPAAFQFNYQLDQALQPAPVQAARAKPEGLFYTNPDLDVTVVEVTDVPEDVAPLTLAPLPVLRDERVNIIQHPGGHYKKISMQNNFVAFFDGRDLQYLTTTEPGSSGSPVFDNDFLVVGVHHSGGNLLEPGSNRRYLRNAGSSMIAVLDDLQANAPEIYGQLRLAGQGG